MRKQGFSRVICLALALFLTLGVLPVKAAAGDEAVDVFKENAGGTEKMRDTVADAMGVPVDFYVEVNIKAFVALVDEIGVLNMWLNEEEAAILNTWAGDNSLVGEEVLTYVRIRLENDYAEKNRSYMVFMDLLQQGLRSKAGSNLLGLGKKLLSVMDTNMNAMAGVTMLSAFRAGDDRRELLLSSDMTPETMRETFYREVYE